MMGMEREYSVVVLQEATKEMMIAEQYRLEEMQCDEWNIHDCCDEIDKKLEKIDEWRRYRAKCGCGYKNRRR